MADVVAARKPAVSILAPQERRPPPPRDCDLPPEPYLRTWNVPEDWNSAAYQQLMGELLPTDPTSKIFAKLTHGVANLPKAQAKEKHF